MEHYASQFVGDSKIMWRAEDEVWCKMLLEDLDRICKWSRMWKISQSKTKCNGLKYFETVTKLFDGKWTNCKSRKVKGHECWFMIIYHLKDIVIKLSERLRMLTNKWYFTTWMNSWWALSCPRLKYATVV